MHEHLISIYPTSHMLMIPLALVLLAHRRMNHSAVINEMTRSLFKTSMMIISEALGLLGSLALILRQDSPLLRIAIFHSAHASNSTTHGQAVNTTAEVR